VTALVAAGAAAALAGCGTTSSNALTQQWYDPTDGTTNSVDMTLEGLAIRGLVVVSDGSDATVLGTFVNDGPDADEVAEISVDGRSATITGDVELAPGSALRVGPPGEARALVSGAELEPGSTTTVEISFGSAPKAELSAIVRAPEGEFSESDPEAESATDADTESEAEPGTDADTE
jgi:hypothetical protein